MPGMSLAADPDLQQRRAADPASSAWVAASAGTGKTKVLTDRVLNLLLAGNDPGKLLCLTFTKAAAAEMANRLNARLSRWAVLGDEALDREIAAIIGRSPDEAMRIRARQLFARVLDQPGGMHILTIHAFCHSLLRRFPLEAGVAPQFELMDDRTARELLDEALAGTLARARSAETGPLAAALATLTARVDETRFRELLEAVANERGRLSRLIAEAGGLDAYLDRLRDLLGLAPGEDEAAIRRALAAEPAFDRAGLTRAAAILAPAAKVTDRSTGEGLARWLEGDAAARLSGLDDHLDLFLTGERRPRKQLATKAMLEREPGLGPVLLAEQDRMVEGWQRLAAARVEAATAALTLLADGFLGDYTQEKERRALLDYDDLILRTRDLLHRPGVAPWVLFKLDGGIDHVLIDEAQDTNPDQWAVVAALAEEFFAGAGARDPGRTVFAVGDAKQSIFSFQRADPQAFIAMREHFRRRATEAEQHWADVPLTVSFRSTQAVLDVVDAVFARDEARAGVALDGAEIRHVSHRRGQAGRVELWPAFEPPDPEAPEPWQMLAPTRRESEPKARLAALIAATIRHWLRSGERLDAADRPIRPGDVMVLVRRRTGFVEALVRRLKRLGIPVAGADRMVLTEQIAVMDLLALGHFLLLPEDDLTLAIVLKSPLVGLDEDQLFALAHGREGGLWDSLRRHQAPWAAQAAGYLSALLARADFVPPYELYAGVLGEGGGRRRLLARLGHEAGEAIDEFLAQAQAYERNHVASLQGFLAWIERGAAEIKRDLDTGGRDEVRIITVHGSKGLQAPIVFLPDTVSVPSQGPTLLWPPEDGPMLYLPAGATGERVTAGLKAEAIRRRDEEYRRLLYVALTRAADRLYVGGWRTKRSGGSGSWYELIDAGMQALGIEPVAIGTPPDAPVLAAPGLVHATRQEAEPRREARPEAVAAETAALADFVFRPPPPEPTPPRPLIASRPAGEEPPVRSPLGAATDKQRYQRGILIHRLLQSLPDLPRPEREAAARRFLARPVHGLEPELQDAIARETLAVLDHPDFAALFGPDSQAEVPVVGLLPGPPERALAARVDRLVVTADEVLVIDYKTNRPPPVAAASVAPAYREQLAAYRAALALIYPDHRIRTLLLWTDGPRIMEIEAEPVRQTG
jgi:ATP-dependent helicase/nuclease subunit A